MSILLTKDHGGARCWRPALTRARDGQRRGGIPRGVKRADPPLDAPRNSAGDLVLIATQDSVLRRQLCNRLDDHGYRVLVTDASIRIEDVAALTRPLVILLDLDGFDMQGLAVIGRIREQTAIPVIALSTQAAEGDKVAALDAGADDYVLRPFGGKELLARIRVAMRFTRSQPPPEAIYQVGPIRIDTARYEVTVDGRSIRLTPIEFRLLAMLARFRGATVSRHQLLHEIWANDAEVHLVRVHISALRRKIELDHAHPRWLITVHNVGYRLCDPADYSQPGRLTAQCVSVYPPDRHHLT